MRVERCFGFGFGFDDVVAGKVARRIRIFRGNSVSSRMDIPMILSALTKERVTEKKYNNTHNVDCRTVDCWISKYFSDSSS